ncbi:MAG: RNase adapter RapZ [Chromatiales bacterium]|nr:RNase adapter RapZ [Chromatiales bacterium]
MKLIIVTGLSGSGKSIALNTLEDAGYYCVDNLPISLLEPFAAELAGKQGHYQHDRAAVGIDARSDLDSLEDFPARLRRLREQGIEVQILFLKAETGTLLKRFSETRRRHPLSSDAVSLAEAIRTERSLLEPISVSADMSIDTTHTNLHQLTELVRQRVEGASQNLSLLFQTFGFKHGPPSDADFVFDVRCLPNPHWEPSLRALTGKDPAVVTFLEQHQTVERMYDDIRLFLEDWVPEFERSNRNYMTVAVGCTGGQHRSVYLGERLARHFQAIRKGVLLRHRELA